MPTFDDTWISPHISIPSTGPGADHNHLGWPTSPLTICCLCGDAFYAEKNPADNRTQRPCHDLSCPECTWLQRNQDLTCQKCAARFPCPSWERTSQSSEVDPLPIPSHRVGGPNDDGYDGDDERGAISNFQSPTLERAHHDPIHSRTPCTISTCPGPEAGGNQSTNNPIATTDGKVACDMPSFLAKKRREVVGR